MTGILDLLNSDLGKQIISGVSSDSNQSESKTADIMSMALPLLMGAMKKNATTPEGAEGLMNALNTKHDGSILDNLGSLFEGGVDANVKQDGAGILKNILGNSENNVTNAISQKSGIDTSTVMNILKVAAPLVLGYLGKQKKQQQVQSSSGIEGLLGGILGGDNKQQSMIESLLDGNNDGSVIDDIAGMVLGGSKGKNGGLGSLLGGFLK
ncbi:MAG: DUF937 domain-containing protein [Flavobacteriaceae bacterium]|nr:DUF937 domain-containing protein [Flavobacteriaceae bacterium]